MVVEDHKRPAVIYSMLIKSGTLDDLQGEAGVTELMIKLIQRGSKNYTAERLAERIDFLGARVDFWVGREYILMEAMFLAKDHREGLDILSDIILNPTFPDSELEISRRELIAEIKSVMQSPQAIAEDYLRNLIYQDYPLPLGETKSLTSVNSIKREDIVEIYNCHFSPTNIVLLVIGDVQTDSILRDIRLRFEQWSQKERIPRLRYTGADLRVQSEPLPRIRLVDKPGLTQSFIALGFPSIKRNSPDYFPYLAINHILGGAGFSSRLQSVVRAEKGKTYSISSRFEAGVEAGPFMIRTFTRSAQTREMVDLIKGVLTELKEKGITAEELAEMKSSQIGGYQLRFQTPSDLAREILLTEHFGLGIDFLRTYPEKIGRLTVEDVNRVAKKYLDDKTFSLVVVGDGKIIDTIIAPFGRYEKVSYQSLYSR